MDEIDKKGFFAERTKLNLEEYVILDYYFESTIDPEEAAAHLCQEQSTVQWKRVGVYDRPIFFGVIKPNIGLNPESFAELAHQGWLTHFRVKEFRRHLSRDLDGRIRSCLRSIQLKKWKKPRKFQRIRLNHALSPRKLEGSGLR